MNTNQKEVYVITQETSFLQTFTLKQVIGIYSSSKQMNDVMDRIHYKMINVEGYRDVPEEASLISNDERRDYGITRRVWVNTGMCEYRFTSYKRVMGDTWMAL